MNKMLVFLIAQCNISVCLNNKKPAIKNKINKKGKRTNKKIAEKCFAAFQAFLQFLLPSFFVNLPIPFPFPFPFFTSDDGALNMFEAIRFLVNPRGVFGTADPKMSLLPPPGGFNTLRKK